MQRALGKRSGQSALLHRPPASATAQLIAGRQHRDGRNDAGQRAYHSIQRRVADMLVRLPTEAPDADIYLSRDDMAALVGMAPESLIRTFSKFRQSGLIELLPNTIRVVQLDKLRQTSW